MAGKGDRNIAKKIGKTLIKPAKVAGNIGEMLIKGTLKEFAITNLPETANLFDTNKDFAKDVVTAVLNPVDTVTKTAKKVIESETVQNLNTIVKYMQDDIKSGKLYQEGRMRTLDDDGMDDFGDIDFGDFDSDGNYNESDDSYDDDSWEIAEIEDENSNERTKASIEAVGTATETIIKSNTQMHKETITTSLKRHADNMVVMENVSVLLGSIHNSVNDHLIALTELNKETHKQLLSEVTEIKNAVIAIRDYQVPKQEDNRSRSRVSPYNEDTGAFDIKGYLQTVVKQALDVTGLDMVVGAFDPNVMFDAIASNPIQFIADQIFDSLVPESTKKSMHKTDKILKGFFPSILSKLTAYGENETEGIKPLLAQIFGYRENASASISTNKNRYSEKAEFTGKVAKAITDVIPTQLSKIISVLEGSSAKIFDYSQGKFVNAEKVFLEEARRSQQFSLSETTEALETMLANPLIRLTEAGSSVEDESKAKVEMKDAIHDFLQNIASKKDGFLRPDMSLEDITMYWNDNYDAKYKQALQFLLSAMDEEQAVTAMMEIEEERANRRNRADRHSQELEDTGRIASFNDLLIGGKLKNNLTKNSIRTKTAPHNLGEKEYSEFTKKMHKDIDKDNPLLAGIKQITSSITQVLNRGIITYSYNNNHEKVKKDKTFLFISELQRKTLKELGINAYGTATDNPIDAAKSKIQEVVNDKLKPNSEQQQQQTTTPKPATPPVPGTTTPPKPKEEENTDLTSEESDEYTEEIVIKNGELAGQVFSLTEEGASAEGIQQVLRRGRDIEYETVRHYKSAKKQAEWDAQRAKEDNFDKLKDDFKEKTGLKKFKNPFDAMFAQVEAGLASVDRALYKVLFGDDATKKLKDSDDPNDRIHSVYSSVSEFLQAEIGQFGDWLNDKFFSKVFGDDGLFGKATKSISDFGSKYIAPKIVDKIDSLTDKVKNSEKLDNLGQKVREKKNSIVGAVDDFTTKTWQRLDYRLFGTKYKQVGYWDPDTGLWVNEGKAIATERGNEGLIGELRGKLFGTEEDPESGLVPRMHIFLFGKKDEEGNVVQEGLFGKLYEYGTEEILDPMLERLKEMGGGVHDWFKEMIQENMKDVFEPIRVAMAENANHAKDALVNLGKTMMTAVDSVFEDTLGKSLSGIADGVVQKGKKTVNWMLTTAGKAVGSALASPFVGIKKWSDTLRAEQEADFQKRRSEYFAENPDATDEEFIKYDIEHGHAAYHNSKAREKKKREEGSPDNPELLVAENAEKAKEMRDALEQEKIKNAAEETAENTKNITDILEKTHDLFATVVGKLGLGSSGEDVIPVSKSDEMISKTKGISSNLDFISQQPELYDIITKEMEDAKIPFGETEDDVVRYLNNVYIEKLKDEDAAAQRQRASDPNIVNGRETLGASLKNLNEELHAKVDGTKEVSEKSESHIVRESLNQFDPNTMPQTKSVEEQTEDDYDNTFANFTGAGPGFGRGRGSKPLAASKLAYVKGYRDSSGGTNPEFFSEYGKAKGIDMHKGKTDSVSITESLEDKRPVALMGKGGDFGKNEHYLLADRLDSRGDVSIVDPIGGRRSTVDIDKLSSNTDVAIYGGASKRINKKKQSKIEDKVNLNKIIEILKEQEIDILSMPDKEANEIIKGILGQPGIIINKSGVTPSAVTKAVREVLKKDQESTESSESESAAPVNNKPGLVDVMNMLEQYADEEDIDKKFLDAAKPWFEYIEKLNSQGKTIKFDSMEDASDIFKKYSANNYQLDEDLLNQLELEDYTKEVEQKQLRMLSEDELGRKFLERMGYTPLTTEQPKDDTKPTTDTKEKDKLSGSKLGQKVLENRAKVLEAEKAKQEEPKETFVPVMPKDDTDFYHKYPKVYMEAMGRLWNSGEPDLLNNDQLLGYLKTIMEEKGITDAQGVYELEKSLTTDEERKKEKEETQAKIRSSIENQKKLSARRANLLSINEEEDKKEKWDLSGDVEGTEAKRNSRMYKSLYRTFNQRLYNARDPQLEVDRIIESAPADLVDDYRAVLNDIVRMNDPIGRMKDKAGEIGEAAKEGGKGLLGSLFDAFSGNTAILGGIAGLIMSLFGGGGDGVGGMLASVLKGVVGATVLSKVIKVGTGLFKLVKGAKNVLGGVGGFLSKILNFGGIGKGLSMASPLSAIFAGLEALWMLKNDDDKDDSTGAHVALNAARQTKTLAGAAGRKISKKVSDSRIGKRVIDYFGNRKADRLATKSAEEILSGLDDVNMMDFGAFGKNADPIERLTKIVLSVDDPKILQKMVEQAVESGNEDLAQGIINITTKYGKHEVSEKFIKGLFESKSGYLLENVVDGFENYKKSIHGPVGGALEVALTDNERALARISKASTDYVEDKTVEAAIKNTLKLRKDPGKLVDNLQEWSSIDPEKYSKTITDIIQTNDNIFIQQVLDETLAKGNADLAEKITTQLTETGNKDVVKGVQDALLKNSTNATDDIVRKTSEEVLEKMTKPAAANVAETAAKSAGSVAGDIAEQGIKELAEEGIEHGVKVAAKEGLESAAKKGVVGALKTGGEILSKAEKKILDTVLDKITNILDKVAKNGIIAKVLGITKKKLGALCKGALTALGRFLPQCVKNAGKKAGKQAVKQLSWLTGPGKPVFTIAFAIWDFISGFSEAYRYFGVAEKDATTGMKLASAIVKTVIGLLGEIQGYGFFLALIPPGPIAQFIYKVIANDEDEAELEQKQQELSQRTAQYNQENGTDLSEEDFAKMQHDDDKAAKKAEKQRKKEITKQINAERDPYSAEDNLKFNLGLYNDPRVRYIDADNMIIQTSEHFPEGYRIKVIKDYDGVNVYSIGAEDLIRYREGLPSVSDSASLSEKEQKKIKKLVKKSKLKADTTYRTKAPVNYANIQYNYEEAMENYSDEDHAQYLQSLVNAGNASLGYSGGYGVGDVDVNDPAYQQEWADFLGANSYSVDQEYMSPEEQQMYNANMYGPYADPNMSMGQTPYPMLQQLVSEINQMYGQSQIYQQQYNQSAYSNYGTNVNSNSPGYNSGGYLSGNNGDYDYYTDEYSVDGWGFGRGKEKKSVVKTLKSGKGKGRFGKGRYGRGINIGDKIGVGLNVDVIDRSASLDIDTNLVNTGDENIDGFANNYISTATSSFVNNQIDKVVTKYGGTVKQKITNKVKSVINPEKIAKTAAKLLKSIAESVHRIVDSDVVKKFIAEKYRNSAKNAVEKMIQYLDDHFIQWIASALNSASESALGNIAKAIDVINVLVSIYEFVKGMDKDNVAKVFGIQKEEVTLGMQLTCGLVNAVMQLLSGIKVIGTFFSVIDPAPIAKFVYTAFKSLEANMKNATAKDPEPLAASIGNRGNDIIKFAKSEMADKIHSSKDVDDTYDVNKDTSVTKLGKGKRSIASRIKNGRGRFGKGADTSVTNLSSDVSTPAVGSIADTLQEMKPAQSSTVEAYDTGSATVVTSSDVERTTSRIIKAIESELRKLTKSNAILSTIPNQAYIDLLDSAITNIISCLDRVLSGSIANILNSIGANIPERVQDILGRIILQVSSYDFMKGMKSANTMYSLLGKKLTMGIQISFGLANATVKMFNGISLIGPMLVKGLQFKVAQAAYKPFKNYESTISEDKKESIKAIDNDSIVSTMDEMVRTEAKKITSGTKARTSIGINPLAIVSDTSASSMLSRAAKKVITTMSPAAAVVSGISKVPGIIDTYKTARQTQGRLGSAWTALKSVFGFGRGEEYGLGRFGRGGAIYDQTSLEFNAVDPTMADAGCGPTVAAMMADRFGKGNPLEASEMAYEGGFRDPDGGTDPRFFSAYGASKGIDMAEGSTSAGEIASSLDEGRPVALMGKGGVFGSGMHYMLADGINDDNTVNLVDPVGGKEMTSSLNSVSGNTTTAIYGQGRGKGRKRFGRGEKNNVINNTIKSSYKFTMSRAANSEGETEYGKDEVQQGEAVLDSKQIKKNERYFGRGRGRYGRGVTTKNGMVYYNQGDSRWGGHTTGGSRTIGSAGCCITSLAMCVSQIAGQAITPDKIPEEHNVTLAGGSMIWGNMDKVAQKFGGHITALSSKDQILSSVANGMPVIIYGQKEKCPVCDYSDGTRYGPHCVVISAVSSDGSTVRVNDPADTDRCDRDIPASGIKNFEQAYAASKDGKGISGNPVVEVSGSSSSGDSSSATDANSQNNTQESKPVQTFSGLAKIGRAGSSLLNKILGSGDGEDFMKAIGLKKDDSSSSTTSSSATNTTATSSSSSGVADSGNNTDRKGNSIKVPDGYGKLKSYMSWQSVTDKTSNQYKFREATGMPFDDEGFGVVNGRKVLAMTSKYGNVGDYVDVKMTDGTVIKGVLGDIKNTNDIGANEWGHQNGDYVVEFIVDEPRWYNKKDNVGTPTNHPELMGVGVSEVINQGSYFEGGKGRFGKGRKRFGRGIPKVKLDPKTTTSQDNFNPEQLIKLSKQNKESEHVMFSNFDNFPSGRQISDEYCSVDGSPTKNSKKNKSGKGRKNKLFGRGRFGRGYEYKVMTIDEFEKWLNSVTVSRSIRLVQVHHTWSPSYSDFNGSNHVQLQEEMRAYHTGPSFGARDIAQHITTFPDGTVMLGRSFEDNPAGIVGANSGAICIENLGNFDSGKDQMREEQRVTIVRVVAALLKKFKLSSTDGVTYHCWWSDGGAYLGDYNSSSCKTCPGTNFFGGNTKKAYNETFKPLIEQAMAGAKIVPSGGSSSSTTSSSSTSSSSTSSSGGSALDGLSGSFSKLATNLSNRLGAITGALGGEEETTSTDNKNSSSSSSSGDMNTTPGSYTPDDIKNIAFPKYTDIPEDRLLEISAVAAGEQGYDDPLALRQELSQMANLNEVRGRPTTWSGGMEKTVKRSSQGGWYADSSWSNSNARAVFKGGEPQKLALDAAREVLLEGKRVLPRSVDEHDCTPDITGFKGRSNYDVGDNVHNRYGSDYKFYTFFGQKRQGDIAGATPQAIAKFNDFPSGKGRGRGKDKYVFGKGPYIKIPDVTPPETENIEEEVKTTTPASEYADYVNTNLKKARTKAEKELHIDNLTQEAEDTLTISKSRSNVDPKEQSLLERMVSLFEQVVPILKSIDSNTAKQVEESKAERNRVEFGKGKDDKKKRNRVEPVPNVVEGPSPRSRLSSFKDNGFNPIDIITRR